MRFQSNLIDRERVLKLSTDNCVGSVARQDKIWKRIGAADCSNPGLFIIQALLVQQQIIAAKALIGADNR